MMRVAGWALTFGVLLVGLSAAANPLPQPEACTTSTDGANCGQCVGGYCDGGDYDEICLCDAECSAQDLGKCRTEPLKPRCGGKCVMDPVQVPVPAPSCGTGADALTIEPLTVQWGDADAGVTVSAV